MKERIVADLHQESIQINKRTYIFDPQGFTFRQEDKITVATFRFDIPTQVDELAQDKIYKVSKESIIEKEELVFDLDKNPVYDAEGKQLKQKVVYVRLPRAEWNRKWSSKTLDDFIVKMRFLARDFFQKYYATILLVCGIILLAVIVDIVMGQIAAKNTFTHLNATLSGKLETITNLLKQQATIPIK
jgi:hypothetical protein